MFPSPAVAGILHESYVEARLHTDGTKNIERIRELQREMTHSIATPIYLLIDPKTGEEKGKFQGSTFDEGEFAAFLAGPIGVKVAQE